MSQDKGEGAPRGTLTPAAGGPIRPERGRFSAQRKMEAVLRLVRGETLDAVARELGASGSTLSGWRDRFLAAGQTALKSRPADERDDEIQRLRGPCPRR
jgi:transposase-like protein